MIAPNWVGSEGVNPGFDFTLPPAADPAPNSALTIRRINGRIRDAVRKVALSPAIHFKANKLMCFWVKWKDFESSMGVYDFSALRAAIDAAVAAGWLIGLRFLTARTVWAPSYMADHNVTIINADSMVSPAQHSGCMLGSPISIPAIRGTQLKAIELLVSS